MGMGIGSADYASAYAASLDMQRRLFQQERMAFLNSPRIKALPPCKCDSCGSREFREHAGRRICAFCRTEG